MSSEDEAPRPFGRVGSRQFPPPGPGGLVTPAQRQARHRREHGSPPPRRDRGLSREEIVRTAIAVADAEGPDAISMRRIARELNAGAMSLYWHVESKEVLLAAMLDAIEAEIVVPDPSGDWRADLATFARRTRAVLRRHGWAIELIGTRPPTGPNDVQNLERMLSLLDQAAPAAADPALVIGVLGTLGTFVTGAAVREAQEEHAQQARERTEAGLTAAELQAAEEKFRQAVVGSGRYPHIARIVESGLDPDDPATRDERFEFSLGCVLDGIAVRLSGPAAPPA